MSASPFDSWIVVSPSVSLPLVSFDARFLVHFDTAPPSQPGDLVITVVSVSHVFLLHRRPTHRTYTQLYMQLETHEGYQSGRRAKLARQSRLLGALCNRAGMLHAPHCLQLSHAVPPLLVSRTTRKSCSSALALDFHVNANMGPENQ